MKTGLFFGTFNPVHNGHLSIARYFLEHSDLEKILFIVSPHNPLKKRSELMDAPDRLEMVKTAIEDIPDFGVSDIEFHLPLPSYTAKTLGVLLKEDPLTEYVLLMGNDSINSIEQWKNFRFILRNFEIYVYPRINHPYHEKKYFMSKIKYFHAPMIDISATEIRNLLKEGLPVSHLVPEKVEKYLIGHHLF